jgi:hypothetical protein
MCKYYGGSSASHKQLENPDGDDSQVKSVLGLHEYPAPTQVSRENPRASRAEALKVKGDMVDD